MLLFVVFLHCYNCVSIGPVPYLSCNTLDKKKRKRRATPLKNGKCDDWPSVRRLLMMDKGRAANEVHCLGT